VIGSKKKTAGIRRFDVGVGYLRSLLSTAAGREKVKSKVKPQPVHDWKYSTGL
jgi:hypothetical protein